LTADIRIGRDGQRQNAGVKTMKLSEKIAPDSTAAPISSFGVRAARPKNVRGGSREIVADLPSETAKNSFELSPPLAQKRLAAAQPSTKSSPIWQEIAKSSEKTDPSFGAIGSKT
jgi:hypothetical protein